MQQIKSPVKYKLITLISIILVFAISLLNSGCNDKAPPKKRSAKHLPAVEVSTAQVQSLNHQITLTATLKPNRTIHFYNQAQGLLLELPYHEGDQVEQGDLLARLDDTIIKAEYNKAKATLRQAQIDYGRLAKLAKTELTSRELLVRAQTKVALDQSEFNLQKKRLSYTQIKAPWSGVISERLVEQGDVLPLHTHFLSLMDTSSLIVNISLSELYLSKINQGDTISYQVDALGKDSWSGKILRIHPQINALTRKGIVEVKLDPVPEGARPGQLARIKLVTEKQAVLVIPLSAIRYDQQGAYVFIVDSSNKIKRSNIITGKKYPQQMEVIDGLKAGDRIVKKGLFGLRSGKNVNIINHLK